MYICRILKLKAQNKKNENISAPRLAGNICFVVFLFPFFSVSTNFLKTANTDYSALSHLL